MKTRIRKSELVLCALVVLILGSVAQIAVNLNELMTITAGEQK